MTDGMAKPLAEGVLSLKGRALSELDAAHDYYEDTRNAWKIVKESVEADERPAFENPATGTLTTRVELAGKARDYMAGPLTQATFQRFLTIFEDFLFDFLRLWLAAYPQGLFARKVDFRAVYEAPDKDAITDFVIDKELNEVLYERPTGWFAYLEERAKLGCPTAEEVGRTAEAKATRDVLVHNRGVANRAYVSKAGMFARYHVMRRGS